MRNSDILLSSLFLLVIIFSLQLVPQAVHATTSQTFPLLLFGTVKRNVELQMYDQLVGNFTISNIPAWTDDMGHTEGYTCAVGIIDPNGRAVRDFENTIGDSFNYNASFSGVYTIEFIVTSLSTPPSGSGNPVATLNYDVVTSSPPPTSTVPSGNLPLWLILTLAASVVVIGIVASAYFISKRRKNSASRRRRRLRQI